MQVDTLTAPASLPPGPRFYPWEAWSFVFRPSRFYASLRGRYGDVATLPARHCTLVLALSPDSARQVLTAAPDSYGAFQTETFTGLTGPGSLWVLDGDRHRQERRLLAPAFHAQAVRAYGEVIQATVHQHTDVWQPGEPRRAYEAMLDISRDLILRIVFGIEGGPVRDEARTTVRRVLDRVTPLISFSPWTHGRWFPQWRRYQRVRREFSAFVDRRLTERRADPGEWHDVLGLLMAARYDDGTAMTDDEIADELVTILLAGHETTAVALSWAIYEVWRHQAVLARLHQELDALGPAPELDTIVRQPYLNAVCDETLRRHTILTEVARVVRSPLALFGHTIPAGVGVGVGICAIHQDPELYPEPTQYRPERFLERTFSQFEFLPFGGGHRRCLGAVLSDYQMRIVLATIVSQWDLEIVGEDQDARHNIGMGPKHGVRMRVIGRRHGA